MANPYRIICLTSDKYIWALRPYLWLVKKYWIPTPEVLIAGFTPPPFSLPGWAKFHSIGPFHQYPFERWTDAVIKLMHEIPDEVFVLMLEDYWLTRQVDTTAVQILVDYAHQFKYVCKIDLCADRLYAYGADLNYGTVGHLDLVKSMPGSEYHMSLMTGVWRKEHFLKGFMPNWTPHQVELQGTPLLSHQQEVIVLGTRQWPVRHTLAFRSQDTDNLLLHELKETDVTEMRELDLFANLEE